MYPPSLPAVMAEVRSRFGKGAFRLLKNSNNISCSGGEEKGANRSALLAVAVSSGIRVCGPQQKDEQAQGGCRYQQCQPVELEVTENVTLPTRETVPRPYLPKKDITLCQTGKAFFSSGLNGGDSGGVLPEDSSLRGFCTVNKLCSCQTVENSELSEIVSLSGSRDLAVTERMSKQTKDPNRFYMLLNTSPGVNVVVNRPSFRNQSNLLMATVLTDSRRTGSEQKRSFCTLVLTERELNHWMQRSRREVISLTRSYGSSDLPLYKSKTAYYDILQVSPNATHAQIKTAYYKQSFIYHPDKNAGSEDATQRFSEISEAYNVLGNKSLKRKYDRGILSKADVQGAGRPSGKDAPASSTTSQQKRSRHSPAVGMEGKSVFDFDAFYRSHYGEQLQREKDLRFRKEQMLKRKREGIEDWKLGRLTEVSVGLLLAMAVGILLSLKS